MNTSSGDLKRRTDNVVYTQNNTAMNRLCHTEPESCTNSNPIVCSPLKKAWRLSPIICILIAFLFLSPVAAQEAREPFTIVSKSLHIDWKNSMLTLQAVLTLDFTMPDQVTAPQKIQRAFDAEFPLHFEPLFHRWTLDSLYTIGQELELDASLRPELTHTLSAITSKQSTISTDLTTLTIEYSNPLYPFITKLFKRPIRDIPIRRFLPWKSTQEYSGLVIYAYEALPLLGTSETAHLQVALFPEIYAEDLRPVLKRENYNNESYQSWGALAYTTSLDESPFLERIGLNPLRILASQVNGVYPTDIVLNNYDAERILHSKHIIDLLQKGRILVIVRDDQFIY